MPHLSTGRWSRLIAAIVLLALSLAVQGITPSPTAAQDADNPVIELMNISEVDLNTFWEQTFTDGNLGTYQPPSGVTPYEGDNAIETACGPTEAQNAFFCPADQGIYYDLTWFEAEYEKSQNNGFAVVGIMAHEWGHHIQNLLEQELQLEQGHYSIEIELQADCLAGNFTRYLYDGNGTLEISNDDLKEGMNGFFDVGDDEAVAWDDPDAHGTSAQRSQAFLMGFNQTVDLCLDTSRIAEIVNIEGGGPSEDATPSN